MRYLFLALLITIQCESFAQQKDSIAIHKIAEIIGNQDFSSDIQSDAMLDLLAIYNKSKNEFITTYAESVFIKASNLYGSLFFHEFEVQFRDKVYTLKMNNRKKVRLYLIMSHKGNGYDYRYYAFAKKEIDMAKDGSYGISRKPCLPENFIPRYGLLTQLRNKDLKVVNDYYLNLLYVCDESEPELNKVRRIYFIVH